MRQSALEAYFNLPLSAASAPSPSVRPNTALNIITVAKRAFLRILQSNGDVVRTVSRCRCCDSSERSIPDSLFCRHWRLSARAKPARSSIIVWITHESRTFSTVWETSLENGPMDAISGRVVMRCNWWNEADCADQFSFWPASSTTSGSTAPRK